MRFDRFSNWTRYSGDDFGPESIDSCRWHAMVRFMIRRKELGEPESDQFDADDVVEWYLLQPK